LRHGLHHARQIKSTPAKYLGSVYAPDEAAPIEAAAQELKVPDHLQYRPTRGLRPSHREDHWAPRRSTQRQGCNPQQYTLPQREWLHGVPTFHDLRGQFESRRSRQISKDLPAGLFQLW